jgi:hypothetical protein
MEMIDPQYLGANKFLELVKFHLLSALLLFSSSRLVTAYRYHRSLLFPKILQFEIIGKRKTMEYDNSTFAKTGQSR